MDELWILILMLAFGTFAIRFAGFAIAKSLPRNGTVVRILNALPGTLISALLAVIVVQGGTVEWIATALALPVAVITRNLPLTMLTGVGAVWILRGIGAGWLF